MQTNIQTLVLTSLTAPELRFLFSSELEAYFERNPIQNKQTITTAWPEKPKSLKDAASFLGIKPNTLYGICSRKEINYTKSGKKLLFFEADLKRYIDARKRSKK